MASISVRNLDPAVHAALQQRAARAGHSMEAEVRRILTEATVQDLPTDPFQRLIAGAQALGGIDLELPEPEFTTRIDQDLPS